MPDTVFIQSVQIQCLYKVANTVIIATLMNLLNSKSHIAFIDYFTRSGREILEFIKIIAVGKNYFWVYLCVPGWIGIAFRMGEAGTNCG